jgi:membrane protease YdiL (CAAX protease family)
MTPQDPSTGPPAASQDNIVVSPQPSVAKWPFWDYQDLMLFITLAFPCLLMSVFVVRLIAGRAALGKPFQSLLAQLIWYALVFSCLYVLLHVKYDRPFWRSLGWKVPFRGVLLAMLSGPFLAFALGYLGYVLRTPEIPMPFRQMFEDRPTMMLFAIFVVVLGPLCEELAFRGFFMPLLMKSLGVAAGIVVTGVLFGSLHAYEYSWSWRHVLLIALAGIAFGWVRYKTDSTAASTFMHATFNLTQFAAFVAQSRTI